MHSDINERTKITNFRNLFIPLYQYFSRDECKNIFPFFDYVSSRMKRERHLNEWKKGYCVTCIHRIIWRIPYSIQRIITNNHARSCVEHHIPYVLRRGYNIHHMIIYLVTRHCRAHFFPIYLADIASVSNIIILQCVCQWHITKSTHSHYPLRLVYKDAYEKLDSISIVSGIFRNQFDCLAGCKKKYNGTEIRFVCQWIRE